MLVLQYNLNVNDERITQLVCIFDALPYHTHQPFK
jgi:hypothetical protein